MPAAIPITFLALLCVLTARPAPAQTAAPHTFAAERSVYEHAVHRPPADIEDLGEEVADVEVSLPADSANIAATHEQAQTPAALKPIADRDQIFAPTETATSKSAQKTARQQPANDRTKAGPTLLSKPGPKLSPLKRPERGEASALPGSAHALATVGASLAVVLAVFFGVIALMRRGLPAAAGKLPLEVVEVLGRTPLVGKQQAHLLRCGSKLLLVSISPGSIETITEITDPLEVDRIAGLCKQNDPNSSTKAFSQVFQQFSQEKSVNGFLEPREEAVAESIMALLRRGAGKETTGDRGV